MSAKRPPPTFQDQPPPSSRTPLLVQVMANNPTHDPIVVSFPRGTPASLPQFTCSHWKSNSDRGRRITGSDETCTYSGGAPGRGHDGRLTKLYVAVLDKRRQTLKLVPAAEKGTIFALEQTVKDYSPAESGVDKELSAADQVNMLVQSFGSQKKRRVLSSRAANVVNINKVVGAGTAIMDSNATQDATMAERNTVGRMDTVEVKSSVEAALLQARINFLPPYDETAKEPHQVYSIPLMAESKAWSQIARIVTKVIKGSQETESTDWVSNLVGKAHVPESIQILFRSINPSAEKDLFRIKSTFFLFLMMRFHHKLSYKRLIKGLSLDDCIGKVRIPGDVGARFFQLFATFVEGKHGGYSASQGQLDKLCGYCLILYVSVSSKEMNVSNINLFCKDMKLDDKHAALILRQAGFNVKKNPTTGEIGVSLSVPLTFPQMKRGKKK